MQQHIHTIVKYFFQKDSLREVPEQVLQQFTEDHPYSAVGHWLLAKKVCETEPERAAAQSAGAVPWFHNPLWLHWTLQDHEPVAETVSMPAATSAAAPATLWERPREQKEPAPALVRESPATAITEAPEAIAGEPVTTPATEETDFTETEILIPGVSEPVSLVEEPPAPASPPPATETALPAAEETAPAAAEAPATALPDSFKPVISESEEPIFEPYHTIDYFASLGIKLRQEDLKDKLGMQLKSFTEWLRSMKRIAPVITEIPAANAMDETLQQSIQEIAGHSVEGKEVITEAMAEVWVKQGSKEKAIAIYEKLSLLNPAKRPYFAARIDQIKAL